MVDDVAANAMPLTGEDDLRVGLSDDAAFRRWYEHTLPRVFGYLRSRCAGDDALAEELTQQTYIVAIEQRSRFDGRADSVTWLCAIARHKLADHFRRLEREERRHQRMVVREIVIEGTGTAEWGGPDQRELIAAALRSLPAAQRAVLTFTALDGLSVAEVGREAGRDEVAVALHDLGLDDEVKAG
jgi:RNA polymerase sigma-70 factor, ECF subfamily